MCPASCHDELGYARRVAAEQIRDHLIRRAVRGETTTYRDLCAVITSMRVQPRSSLLMTLLDEACSGIDAERGVVHPALVVRANTGMPGEGYFAWCEHEGRDVSDREALWRADVARVFDAWSKESE